MVAISCVLIYIYAYSLFLLPYGVQLGWREPTAFTLLRRHHQFKDDYGDDDDDDDDTSE
jgi:hypothetical protein